VLILTYPNIITDNYTHHLYSRCRWCEDWATQPIHSSHIYPAGPPPITPHSHFTPLSLFKKKTFHTPIAVSRQYTDDGSDITTTETHNKDIISHKLRL